MDAIKFIYENGVGTVFEGKFETVHRNSTGAKENRLSVSRTK